MYQQDSYSLRLVTGPTSGPVTVEECKAASRVDSTSEDDFLEQLLAGCIEQVELDTDLKLMPQTWEMTLDCFPGTAMGDYHPSHHLSGSGCPIVIPMSPIAGVAIMYDDLNDQEQTLSTARYYSRLAGCPGKVYPVPNFAWPSTSIRKGSVRVTITAGYANAAAVPQRAKQAIYMLFGHWCEHRGLSTTRNYTDINFAYKALTVGLRPGMV